MTVVGALTSGSSFVQSILRPSRYDCALVASHWVSPTGAQAEGKACSNRLGLGRKHSEREKDTWWLELPPELEGVRMKLPF